MKTTSRALQTVIWGLLVLAILGISVAYVLTRFKTPTGQAPLPIGQVVDFTLTNQHGQSISLASLRGQVWVGDIIFTRCPGPCAKMTQFLSELQSVLPPGAPVKFVSLTTDPDHDTPPVLKNYAERFGAQPERWYFLTGDKKLLHHVAVDGLKLALRENSPEERESPQDLFVHSTMMALIDKQGRLRQVCESTEPDSKQRILAGIEALLKSP